MDISCFRNLDISRRFYRDLLLLIQVASEAAPIPQRPRVGLYHFGLKIGESDDELRAAIARLHEASVPVGGMSDHGVTHSVYLLDPDGNEIEIYIDVQPAQWRENPEGVRMYTRPLRI